MSKDLIRGFLLAHNAPQEIMFAFEMATTQPTIVVRLPEIPPLEDLLDELRWENQGIRAINCIKNEGIKSTEELLKLTRGYLLKAPNFGRVSLRAIETVLSKYKLKLGS